MALLNSVLPQLLWVVVIAFQVVQSIDSESIQPAKGKKTLVICENYHNDIQCPDGKITIKNAYYGRKDKNTCPHYQIKDTNCKAANSTDFIRKKCEKYSKCHLEATNSIFGDPCVNTYKYISVDYICEGHNIHSEIICENDSKKISCPEGTAIKIKNASYGRKDDKTCFSEDIKTTDCSAETSLSVVNKKCENMNKCNLEATNSWFTDPCVDTYKYLSVEYQCVQEKPIDPTNKTEIITICESTNAQKITCPKDTSLLIEEALYGRLNKNLCPHAQMSDTKCKAGNAFQIVNNRCKDKAECELQATNSWFGDPCVNTYKYLQVKYRCVKADNTHSETICENDSKKISCLEGMSIKIKNASYGRMDNNTCFNENIKTTNCRAETSLSVVNKRCENMNKCNLEATNSWFTDPCVGTYKYLSVEYQCVQEKPIDPTNKTKIITICESTNAQKITCPKGTSLLIEEALYGRLNKNLCPHAQISDTLCKAGNAFQIVNNRCKGKAECELQATNSWFGDPCVNTYKYLQVEYRCVKG